MPVVRSPRALAIAAAVIAVLALGWIASRAPLGAAGPGIADELDRMIAQDRGRTLTAGVNEDALRLATRLRRAGAAARN